MAKTNNAKKAKKVVIAGAGEPPPALGRLIAEQLATQQANAPASFHEQPEEEPDQQPMTLTLPPVGEQHQAPTRYFISATFTLFEAGYHEISVAGVHTLSEDDLDNIEGRIHELFDEQITAALKKFKASWMGLPCDSRLVINTINRL